MEPLRSPASARDARHTSRPMEFVISGAAPLRHFSKFLAALGRIGTHVALEPTPGALRLSAVNPSKSAFAVITLLPAFFESYRGAGECGSLLVKSLLSVFRNKVERTVSRCIVRLGVEGDDRDRLVLQLVCENGWFFCRSIDRRSGD